MYAQVCMKICIEFHGLALTASLVIPTDSEREYRLLKKQAEEKVCLRQISVKH